MRKGIVIFIILGCVIQFCFAQRRVSPVENKPKAISTIEQKKAAEKLLKNKKYRHSIVYGDSIVTDSAALNDTVKKVNVKYPLFHSVTIGVNVWDLALRALGQSYGGSDVSAELNLFNRIMPVVEFGMGSANNSPKEGNFTYKGKMSMYGKIGVNYNFLFNGNPDYILYAGLRFGYSNFKYDISNITINSGYWGETSNIDILDQKSYATWGEALLGLRVKIYKDFSMGWAFRYHSIFKYKKNPNSNPWYIPGFGPRTQSITASFTLSYTIPIKHKEKVKPVDLGTPNDSISHSAKKSFLSTDSIAKDSISHR